MLHYSRVALLKPYCHCGECNVQLLLYGLPGPRGQTFVQIQLHCKPDTTKDIIHCWLLASAMLHLMILLPIILVSLPAA